MDPESAQELGETPKETEVAGSESTRENVDKVGRRAGPQEGPGLGAVVSLARGLHGRGFADGWGRTLGGREAENQTSRPPGPPGIADPTILPSGSVPKAQGPVWAGLPGSWS